MSSVVQRIDSLGRRKGVAIALAGAVAAAVGDWLTGADTVFTILYTLPVALAAWVVGKWALPIAVVEVAASATTRYLSGARVVTLVWNHCGELAVLVLVTSLVDALHQRVVAEESARRSAVDQLRHAERLTTLGKLVSSVAHEIGTPLSVLSGHAERIASGKLGAERTTESARIILLEAKKITTIVRQLLDFGRRHTGARGPADLTGLSRATVALLQPLARQRGVQLDLVAAQSVSATVSVPEIEQVLTNLIVNALQATKSGGHVEVKVVVNDQTKTADLVVEDTGSGIAPEIIAHVFDPFFTTKGPGEGTGLGLSVSHNIVREHGGSIHVQSEVGRGSRFVVTLPRS
ncbi:MAG TPA: ATP-binding protein [Polyangiaceae bacterium]|nr:ATP-binding protein [Polyangiaceae bacterium]